MSLIGSDVSTGDGVSLGVSLVLLEIPDDNWVRRAIVTALSTLTIEENWLLRGSNSQEISAAVFSLILATLQFDYEPPPMVNFIVGSGMLWYDNSIPNGWLVCNGQAVSRTTYGELFALWGVQFGNGDGSTTFNLPNLSERSPMGVGGTVGLGDTLGEAEHTLTTAEIPAHSHTFVGDQHSHLVEQYNGTPGGTTPRFQMPTGGLAASRATGNAFASGTNENTGGGEAHNNVHPVLGVHFIVYTGVE